MFQSRLSFMQYESRPAGGERSTAELVTSREEEHEEEENSEEENEENKNFQRKFPDKWWIDAAWEVNEAVWVRFKSLRNRKTLRPCRDRTPACRFFCPVRNFFTTFGPFNDPQPANPGGSLSCSDHVWSLTLNRWDQRRCSRIFPLHSDVTQQPRESAFCRCCVCSDECQ